uniref:CAP-Gly domain-containing protein n=1 Tax=Chlamydomonas leiostraca TaxID=1034604 RepID=A0A7S0RMZ6_9CHLO|mmetsp:Transcript_27233/g.69347  ORF Transcript_27233/g.69347 Transcript_27233/m.69347 type:complete len:286 (+) Transcript_27233:66-923(+)
MTTSAPFITKEDVVMLKDYVMGSTGQNRAESTVLLHVSHSNLQAKFFELRLDMHMSIEQLKVKLSFHVGTNPSAQVLQLLDDKGSVLCPFLEDGRKLGYYSPHDGYTIHVVDTDPASASAGGWLEDVSLVDKYRMSDEEYNKRENTYRRWKEGKLKEDPTWTLEKEMAKKRGVELPPTKAPTTDPEYMAAEASSVTVGARCSVDPGDRRGEVMFVGKDVAGLPLGWWVGVKYDEPLGKNDGTVGGVRRFTCPPGYGGFVRPDKVKCGDFPPLDDGLSDLDSGDEI